MRELSHLVLTSKDSFSRLFLQRNKSVSSICLYFYSNSFVLCHNFSFGFVVHNTQSLLIRFYSLSAIQAALRT